MLRIHNKQFRKTSKPSSLKLYTCLYMDRAETSHLWGNVSIAKQKHRVISHTLFTRKLILINYYLQLIYLTLIHVRYYRIKRSSQLAPEKGEDL